MTEYQVCPKCGIKKLAKKGQFDRHDPSCNNRERCEWRVRRKQQRAQKSKKATGP